MNKALIIITILYGCTVIKVDLKEFDGSTCNINIKNVADPSIEAPIEEPTPKIQVTPGAKPL